MPESSRNVADDPHTELFRQERRADVYELRFLRQPKHIPIERERRQRSGKQHARVRRSPTGSQEARGNHIPQCQLGGVDARHAPGRSYGEVADRIAIEVGREATETDRSEIMIQQFGRHAGRLLG